jgi:PAS domain S-box-containing protein
MINDGIHIHEIESDGSPGKFIEVNEVACRMLQYTREELLKHSPLDFVTGFHSRPREEIFAELLTTGHAIFETEHRRKDGTFVPVEVNAHVVDFRGRRIVVSAIRDITDRKKAEDALSRANRKLKLLTGITRHDLNNQVLVLGSYLSLLESEQPDLSSTKYFSEIEKTIQRISAIIRFTKEYELIGVNAPVWQDCRTLVEAAAGQAPLGPIRLKNDLAGTTELFADPLIARVFYNLIDNAIRYGGKITWIRFFAEERDGNLVVVCEDDGDGIADDEKERIFDRGYGKNTGLGLALSREILDITGITIRETGKPGSGARFEITVPLEQCRVPLTDH